jgi:hypothetical protein
LSGATGGPKGAGTINAAGLYVNGVAVTTGGVTSVVGTANEIAVSTTAGVATVSFAPNIVVPAPSSGVALTVSGQATPNVFPVSIYGANSAGSSNGLLINAGVSNSGDRALDILNFAGTTRLFGVFGDGSFALGYNGTSSIIVGAAAGNVTINASSAATTTLTVKGVATSTGFNVQAGASGTDYCAIFANATNTAQYFTIYGDGGVVVGTPTGGDKGLGTLNAATKFYVAGVAQPVFSAAITGYGTPTGGSHQASFAAGSITLPNLAAAVAQLIIDLKTQNLIAA